MFALRKDKNMYGVDRVRFKYMLLDTNKYNLTGYLYVREKEAYVIGKEFLEKATFLKESGNLSGKYYIPTYDTRISLNSRVKEVLKTDGIKVHYYNKFNRQTLKNIGILVLPRTYQSLFLNLAKYIEDKHIEYTVSYTVYQKSSDTVIDKTNRSLVEILQQGYRGNRLDLMVNATYNIELHINGLDIQLGVKEQGDEIVYSHINYLLDLICVLDRKIYNDVCFV
jgi:hypothetical protein